MSVLVLVLVLVFVLVLVLWPTAADANAATTAAAVAAANARRRPVKPFMRISCQAAVRGTAIFQPNGIATLEESAHVITRVGQPTTVRFG